MSCWPFCRKDHRIQPDEIFQPGRIVRYTDQWRKLAPNNPDYDGEFVICQRKDNGLVEVQRSGQPRTKRTSNIGHLYVSEGAGC